MLEFHEAAEIFPLMEGQAFELLVADIDANGVREPIWLYEGKILDGRNRYRACQRLNRECPSREWVGKGSPFAFVASQNVHRRHLTESQRAQVAVLIKKQLESEARKRQGHGLTGPGRTLTANLPEAFGKTEPDQRQSAAPKRENGESREHAARIANVSPRMVDHAERVERDGIPELSNAVREGSVKVTAASEISRLPKPEQRQVLQAGPDAIREKASELRQERNGTATTTPPIVEPPPEKDWPKIWWKHWSKLCGWMTTMARRGGFKRLAKNWPKEDIQKHIGLLKRYRRFIDQCISQLEEVA